MLMNKNWISIDAKKNEKGWMYFSTEFQFSNSNRIELKKKPKFILKSKFYVGNYKYIISNYFEERNCTRMEKEVENLINRLYDKKGELLDVCFFFRNVNVILNN